MVRVSQMVHRGASFFEKDQFKNIRLYAKKLFLTIWWYTVEKRLGTPDIKYFFQQTKIVTQQFMCVLWKIPFILIHFLASLYPVKTPLKWSSFNIQLPDILTSEWATEILGWHSLRSMIIQKERKKERKKERIKHRLMESLWDLGKLIPLTEWYH